FDTNSWASVSEELRKTSGRGVAPDKWGKLMKEVISGVGSTLNKEIAPAFQQYIDISSLANKSLDKSQAFEELSSFPGGFAGFNFWGESIDTSGGNTGSLENSSSPNQPNPIGEPSKGLTGAPEGLPEGISTEVVKTKAFNSLSEEGVQLVKEGLSDPSLTAPTEEKAEALGDSDASTNYYNVMFLDVASRVFGSKDADNMA